MPSNTLSHQQMSRILHEQFRDVEALGFTADGVNKVFRSGSRSEQTFRHAAQAICKNKDLIESILSSCPTIQRRNLQVILLNTSTECAAVIQKLYDRRNDISEFATTGKFSGSNLSSIIPFSGVGAKIKCIDVLLKNRNSLFRFINTTEFSAINISSMLSVSGSKLDESIQALVSNKEQLLALMQAGFSASNISSMLHGSGARLGKSIQALISNKDQLLALRDVGFSADNISSVLNGHGAKLGESIQALLSNKKQLLALMQAGFSAGSISSMLHGSGSNLGKSIKALIQHQADFQVLRESRYPIHNLRIKLREYAKQFSEPIEHNPPVAQIAQEVVLTPNTLGDNFLLDLADLLLPDSIEVEQFSASLALLVEALAKHRETLFKLRRSCGFSANNIANMLQGSQGDLNKAIRELGKLKELLFGLINEGHFTADQLAEKLRGGGEKVGEAFFKDAEVRAALHASYQNAQAKPKAAIPEVSWLDNVMFHEVDESSGNLGGRGDQLNETFFEEAAMAPVAEDFSLEGHFFEKDDSDISLLDFYLQDSSPAAPAAKRPRFF